VEYFSDADSTTRGTYSGIVATYMYIYSSHEKGVNPWLRLYNYVVGIIGEMRLKIII
jgi:hypothetical protein